MASSGRVWQAYNSSAGRLKQDDPKLKARLGQIVSSQSAFLKRRGAGNKSKNVQLGKRSPH